MESSSKFDLENSPESYFRNRLLEALGKLRLEVHAWTEFYLVDLLARKAASVSIGTPLVLQIKAAVESPRVEQRFEHYRSAGDSALLLSGFFNGHLERRALSRSYVRNMGVGAYRATASLSSSFDGLKEAYENLSERFEEISLVLNEVRELTSFRTPQEVLALYEAFNARKSPSVAERLSSNGLVVGLGSADEN